MSQERYNASRRPSYSADQLWQEFAAIMRAIPSAVRRLIWGALPDGTGTWDVGGTSFTGTFTGNWNVNGAIRNETYTSGYAMGSVTSVRRIQYNATAGAQGYSVLDATNNYEQMDGATFSGSFAPGTGTIRDGQYAVMVGPLTLNGTDVLTIDGTGVLVIL